MKLNPFSNIVSQTGWREYKSSPKMVILESLKKSLFLSNHLFAAAFSQSCLSCPSCGVMNSGEKGITFGLLIATKDGVIDVSSRHSLNPISRGLTGTSGTSRS